jgi:hypothetical protein
MDLDLQEPKNLPWPMSESIHCKPELHVGTCVERERPAYKHLDVSQSYLRAPLEEETSCVNCLCTVPVLSEASAGVQCCVLSLSSEMQFTHHKVHLGLGKCISRSATHMPQAG